MNSLPPLSLYIHLPWCVRKCPYCDFNSHKAGDAPPRDRYIDALISDLQYERAQGRGVGRLIETVFIGGGTPSLFSGDEIAELLVAVAENLSLAESAEITMEANPGTIEHGNLKGYRQAGVNRLSLGAQSFSEDALKALGRIHGPSEIITSFDEARLSGFDNINLDVMYGLPGQDVVLAMKDLEAATSLGPEHLSWYHLTLEPNTIFHQRPPADLPDEETCWEIQDSGFEQLANSGFEQYEVSAFARAEMHCAHNLNYWTFGDYLAVGAGAHGKVTGDAGDVVRYRKPAHPSTYMEQSERGELHDHAAPISAADLVFEYMLNALRLPRGFKLTEFSSRTGLPSSVLDERLGRARDDGLMQTEDGDHWWPSDLGVRFLNDLQGRFLP
jgi:putative oxygen-independent coproporphyrinogen III oxidase